MYQEQAGKLKDELAARAVRKNGAHVIIEKVSLPSADALKNLAYSLRNQFDDLLLVLAAEVDNKPMVAVMLGEKLAAAKPTTPATW